MTGRLSARTRFRSTTPTAIRRPGVVTPGHSEWKSYLDLDGDGRAEDDDRDVDGDGLRNVDEIRGLHDAEPTTPAGERSCGYEYVPTLPRPFQQPDYMAWDSDGDGVWDGNDDQDSDDVSNVDEIQAPFARCTAGQPTVARRRGTGRTS